jgi:hypothetical protein
MKALLIFLVASPALSQVTTYTYTGAPLTVTQQQATSPGDTSYLATQVTGSVTLNQPLAENGAYQLVFVAGADLPLGRGLHRGKDLIFNGTPGE